MVRLLLLLLLAAAPLFAAAHNGHHAPPHNVTPATEQAAPAADAAAFVALATAPMHCPGGGQDTCCCHGFACATPAQPVAAIDMSAGWRAPALPVARVPHAATPALRSVVLLQFPPRGPPLLS